MAQLVEVMNVDIAVPANYLSDVLADLMARGAKIVGFEPLRDGQIVSAHLPRPVPRALSEWLRSSTRGRAAYSSEFHHYAPVDGRDGGEGTAGVPSPLKPSPPTLSAGAVAKPPPLCA